MKKRILCGVANYEEIVAKNGCFIDKTRYIEKLEEIETPVFLRPRRFGNQGFRVFEAATLPQFRADSNRH